MEGRITETRAGFGRTIDTQAQRVWQWRPWRFSDRSPAQILAIALVGVALVGAMDFATGVEVSSAIFYVVPVAFAAAYAGRWSGVLIAIASSATWLAADLSGGHSYSHLAIPAWNAATRLGIFLVVAFALDSVQRAMKRLETSNLALQVSEEQLRELFAQASDGIFIADLDGRYTDVNGAGCRMLGYTRHEIVGKTILDLIPPAEVDRLMQSKQEMLAGGVHVAEWSLRRKDGAYLPVEVSAKILFDGRWLGFVRDITERKRAADATKAMAAELEARVAERTAQLRTLAAELAAAEDRERRQIARDLHDDLAQTLAAAEIKLANLCEFADGDVRAIAREIDELIRGANRAIRSLAAQLAPPVLYELGLVAALQWLADEIADTYGLEVVTRDDGQSKPLSQESRAIVYRAVRELLINVAKHAGVGAATVTTTRAGDRVVVTVSDAGVGFDPVSVVQSPRRGLGLASVRERLAHIGGTAEIGSVPGDGTVATLAAPLAVQESAASERRR